MTYTSLKSVYSIMDTYSFPLVRSRVQCTCDCPGGAAHCQVSGHIIIIIIRLIIQGGDMCGNSTNCHTFHSQAVSSTGCFLQWRKLSASVCCKIEVRPN